MSLIQEFAPAKLNLYLHIVARRADGYHDLDSLVAFASVGDQIKLYPSETFSFAVEGAQAHALQGEPDDKNLVVQAARSLAELTGHKLVCKLVLEKNLPVASGIGGGSSDAAAALRALARYWKLATDDPRLLEAAARHGQDVPACLKIANNYLTPDGVAPAPDLPHIDCVLVNPGQGLPTPGVYKSYREHGDAFSPAARFEKSPIDKEQFVAMLKARGNDLLAPACRMMPEINVIIKELEKTGALLSRMSGSGATCFGLYADRGAARQAAASLLAANTGWWVTQAHLPYRPA